MLHTQKTKLHSVIFNGCEELKTLDEINKIKGRKPPEIKYQYEIESGTIYPQISNPDATDDAPTIKPTIEKPIILSTADTHNSLYNDCDSFHDSAGVLG